MTIETTVMPVAGAGTRVFPTTTAIEKCLMPIYAGINSRPIIDFMVEDSALAGIKRVIFITSERGKIQLQDYFGNLNSNLEKQLKRLGKDDKIAAELERRKKYDLTYEYIIQPPDQYGTAYPPFLAQSHLAGEKKFALMGGDDFIYRQDGGSELAEAIDVWQQSGTDHVIMGNPIIQQEGPMYGILQVDEEGHLVNIDEKPPIERVPEYPIANISRYIFSDKIWPHINAEMARERGQDEHFITYCINDALADKQSFQVYPVKGKYLVGGSHDGLLEASQYITAHPQT